MSDSKTADPILKRIRELLEEAEMEHGTINGVRDCPTGSAARHLLRFGHVCRRCHALEKISELAGAL